MPEISERGDIVDLKSQVSLRHIHAAIQDQSIWFNMRTHDLEVKYTS